MFLDGPSFVDYWRNVRARTLRVLDVLPPADLEWTHTPGKYTFGDIFRHLPGIERYMYGETVRHRPSAYPGHSAELARGPDEIRAYMDRCHAESLDHGLEVAAGDGRARGAPPRPALPDGGDARNLDSAALRAHGGRGRRAVAPVTRATSIGSAASRGSVPIPTSVRHFTGNRRSYVFARFRVGNRRAPRRFDARLPAEALDRRRAPARDPRAGSETSRPGRTGRNGEPGEAAVEGRQRRRHRHGVVLDDRDLPEAQRRRRQIQRQHDLHEHVRRESHQPGSEQADELVRV